MQPAFKTPDWAQHAVWYQIFPERFRNGDKSQRSGEYRGVDVEWISSARGPGGGNQAAGAAAVRTGRRARRRNGGSPGPRGGRGTRPGNRHYGGDIQGIQAELPYLRSLGVTAIYLNPVFKSPSMHKYDTTDYRHVDDDFGSAGDTPS